MKGFVFFLRGKLLKFEHSKKFGKCAVKQKGAGREVAKNKIMDYCAYDYYY